jgi:SMODS and SLOG-associating 2TM effector domain 1
MTGRAAEFRGLYRQLRIADQLGYYGDRQTEYKKANQQAITVRTVLLALAALAGLAGQLVTGTNRALIGVAAALLAALAAAVTAYEALIGFTQVGKLYNDAALSLKAAEIDWNALGRDDDVAGELGQVEQIFRSENGQWGQLVIEGTPKEPTAGTGAGGQ